MVTNDRNARKLFSNTHLLIAIAEDWPIAQPVTQPAVCFEDWLTGHPRLEHASTAALKLRTELETLHPPLHVKGGVILIASCSGGRPEAMEITGSSKLAQNYTLCLTAP